MTMEGRTTSGARKKDAGPERRVGRPSSSGTVHFPGDTLLIKCYWGHAAMGEEERQRGKKLSITKAEDQSKNARAGDN